MSSTEPDRSDLNPTETGKHPQPEQGNPEQPGNPNLGLRDGKLTLESLDDAERKRTQRAARRQRPGSRPPGKFPKALSQSRRTIPEPSVQTPGPTAATKKSDSEGSRLRCGRGSRFKRRLPGSFVANWTRPCGDLCRLGARPTKPSTTCVSGSNACGPCCGWFAASWEMDSTGKRTGRCETRRPRFPTSRNARVWSMPWRSCDVAMATSRRPLSTRCHAFSRGGAPRYPRSAGPQCGGDGRIAGGDRTGA